MALLMTHYRANDVTKSSGAGKPPTAAFIEATHIKTIAQKPDVLLGLETRIYNLRENILPILLTGLPPVQANIDLWFYVDLLVRCTLSKAWPSNISNFTCSVPLGKINDDKVRAIGCCWAKWLNLKHPGSDWPSKLGLEEESKSSTDEPDVEVDIAAIKSLKRGKSDPHDLAVESLTTKFTKGQAATTTKRMTWEKIYKDDPERRKDISPGTQGVVQGYVDATGRQVLFRVQLQIDDSKKYVTRGINPLNLMDSAEYETKHCAGVSEALKKETDDPPNAKRQKTCAKSAPEWALGKSIKNQVTMEPQWPSLVTWGSDDLCKTWFLKSRIGVMMHCLNETLPTFGKDELMVIWGVEVWTLKDFEPQTLIFAPHSSQLKDSHLMLHHHAVVGAPKHGRGSHPTGKVIALDGRSKNKVGLQGEGEGPQVGEIFWVIERTSKAKDANLVFEPATAKMTLNMAIAGTKKPRTDTWKEQDMPHIPLLINKHKVRKQTKLVAYQKGT